MRKCRCLLGGLGALGGGETSSPHTLRELKGRRTMRRTTLLVGIIIAAGVSLVAQNAPPGAPPPGTVNVDADPIRCWWRTSANAVRVGESFSLTLTCAIVENETTTVVPDQSRLDPSAMQLPPFEVIGGQREP